MAQHNELGKKGEELAVAHLVSKGYKIIHTNWRLGKFEIDIIAEKSDLLIIAEVKTRSTDYFEAPEEAINNRKIRNLVNGANAYIESVNWMGETRFDVISILPNGKTYQIDHIEDAFLAPVNF